MRKVRYILTTKSSGVVTLATDPDGWKDDERQIVRDSKYYGLIYEFAGELSFSQDGYEIITQELSTNGHNANILLRRDRLNYNDEWELDYIGALDVTTKKENDRTISFKLSDAGLTKTIKAQFNEKFELDRLDSVNGTTIPALTYDIITLTGRNLLIDSKLQDNELKTITAVGDGVNGFENYYIPALTKTFSGDTNINSVFPFPLKPIDTGSDFRPSLNSSHFILLQNDIEKTIEVRTTLDLDIECNFSGYDAFIYLAVYEFDGTNYTFKSSINLVSENEVPTTVLNINQVDTNNISLSENDSLALIVYVKDIQQTGGSTFQYSVTQRDVLVETSEDSKFQQTTCEGLSVYNAINRLTEIITDNPLANSLGLNDEWKELYITNGFKIRGFDETITISLKEVMESIKSVLGYHYGIESNLFRVDSFSTFFNLDPLMTLKINDIEETYNDSLIFNSIEAGYKDDTDYEERQGLDEYNIGAIYNHGFQSTDKKLDLISEIRADSYGVEFARRKQFEDFPTEDTQYDKDNFFIDCKVDGFLQPRIWSDDYSVLPTGVYSPETAQNLRLSPSSNIYRLSNTFAQISDYRSGVTRFTSTEGNSKLATTLIGGFEIKENEDIQNNTLLYPIVQPIDVSGIIKLTEAQFDLLKGMTNGQMNAYRSIRYFYKGEEQLGFLQSYNNEGDGTIKLIKANLRR
tara:strand:- start:3892 stop:5964 length:2073 start_codon:yes stop_codon:yes gene_type:complete